MVDPSQRNGWIIFALCEQLRAKGVFTDADFSEAAARIREHKANTTNPDTPEQIEAAAKFLDTQAGGHIS